MSNMDKLSYLGETFSFIYENQVSRTNPDHEEVSFIDKVTKIPALVIDARATGSVAPKESDPSVRVSF